MFDLGSLKYTIEVDDKDAKKGLASFKKGIAGATKNTAGFGKMASSVGKIFKGAVVTAIVAGVAKISKALVMAASNAEETQNKFDVTFSDMGDQADAAAKNLAKSYGLSRTASKALLSDTGDLLSGFGFTQEGALELSEQTQMLAVDLASFTNYSGGATGASAALTKALLGETEGLKALGISISQADIKQLAEDKGITGELDRQTKAMLTLELATKQSGNAIGDFQRSQAGFANQSRIAQANIDDLKVALGAGLLPAANLGVTLFNNMAGELVGAADGIKDFVTSADGAEKISKVFGVIAGVFETVKTVGAGLFSDVFESLKNLVGPLSAVAQGSGNVAKVMKIVAAIFQVVGAALKIVTTWVGHALTVWIDYGKVMMEVAKVVGYAVKVFLDPFDKEARANLDRSKKGFVDAVKGVKDNITKSLKATGSVAMKEAKTFLANNKELSEKMTKNFSEANSKIKVLTYDSLVAQQKADEEAVKSNKEKNDKILEQEKKRAEEEAAANAKRIAENKATLNKIADETEKYAGYTMDFLSSLSQIKDNEVTRDLNNQQRALEVKKQTWDAEAEAQKAALDESVLGTEEYNKRIEEIDEANKKKQLEADYQLQMAKYKQEVDAFERSKALAIAQIWIQAAVATMRAFAEMGWISGLIVAAATSTVAVGQTIAVANQPPPVKPVKPAFADGGIVSNPGPGIDAIVGEAGPEAILPLNDSTLGALGSAIVQSTQASTAPMSNSNNGDVSFVLQDFGKVTIRDGINRLLQDRQILVPSSAII